MLFLKKSFCFCLYQGIYLIQKWSNFLNNCFTGLYFVVKFSSMLDAINPFSNLIVIRINVLQMLPYTVQRLG